MIKQENISCIRFRQSSANEFIIKKGLPRSFRKNWYSDLVYFRDFWKIFVSFDVPIKRTLHFNINHGSKVNLDPPEKQVEDLQIFVIFVDFST